MISLETIGFYSDEPKSQKYPPPFDQYFPSTGNFVAIVGNLQSKDLVDSIMAGFRKHAQFPSEGIAASDRIPEMGFSDQWSFWKNGYPGVMITDTAMFRYLHYHENTDTPDKLDYSSMARVVEGIGKTIRELADTK